MSTLNHHTDKDYWLDSVYTAFVLSGLFGLYTGIFTLAVWSTSQKGVPWRKVVRTVTITTWILIATYVVTTFATLLSDDSSVVTTAFHVAHNRMVCIISPLVMLLSDGMLAWRCFVLWGSRAWVKWVLTVLLVLICVTSITVSFQGPGRETMLAWAIVSLLINSVMTIAVLIRLRDLILPSGLRKLRTPLYRTLTQAFAESALVAWVGLVVCSGTQFLDGPQRWTRIGVFTLDILPIVLGISQTLMVAHIGLSRFKRIDVDHAAEASIIVDHWFTEHHGDLVFSRPPSYKPHG